MLGTGRGHVGVLMEEKPQTQLYYSHRVDQKERFTDGLDQVTSSEPECAWFILRNYRRVRCVYLLVRTTQDS